jgi:hypothetical protein
MNKVFDYNGTFVSASKPLKQLKTVRKVLNIDSGDRDLTKYLRNNDFVIYLPRVYENVVSIRLMAAEFPLLVIPTAGGVGAQRHLYKNGQNVPTTTWTDSKVVKANNIYYFLIDIEGLNKSDECAELGNRSSFPDSYFAKIPASESNNGLFIEYNDHSAQDNVSRYSPAIGKLDRMHIRTRLHTQQGNQGFIYWTSDGAIASGSNQKAAEFSLSFEIEYLDNVFDDFSSLETRISERGV